MLLRQVSAAFAPPAEEPEAVTAMKEHLRTRMKEQEEHEASSKTKGEQDARSFLEVWLFGIAVRCLLPKGFSAFSTAEICASRRGSENTNASQ